MNCRFVSTILLLFSLLLCVPAFSQYQEEVNVNIIEIWARVTDSSGRLVSDLKPDEFSILIDGKPMPLKCFDRTFEAKQVAPEKQAVHLKRKYIFFFDLLNSTSGHIDYMKKQVAQFLNENFHESDEGMVFVLLPNMHLGVVQNLTSNKEALVDVIGRMRGNPSLEAQLRNNEQQLNDIFSAYGTPAPDTAGIDPKADLSDRSGEMIRTARGFARSLALQEENTSRLVLNAFLTIAEYLQGGGATEGHPVMLFVSGGFPLRPGENYLDMINELADQMQLLGNEDSLFHDFPVEDFTGEVKSVLGILNRMNVTIYSIDSKGLISATREPDRNTPLAMNKKAMDQSLQDSLNLIAHETGGTVFMNSQNFRKGLTDIVSDMNEQYWLCSDMPTPEKRGTYHKIEVKIARPGLQIRHRAGYAD